MRRRDFIVGATAATAVPLSAHAQKEPTRRVAIVSGFSSAEMGPLIAAFRQALAKLGWLEGRNVFIDLHLASGNTADLGKAAAAALATNPDLVVAQGTPGLVAVQKVSRTVPVVFNFVGDPVGQGFVASLSRPGGHATGFTNFEFSMAGKWLELLMESSPGLRRVLWLSNPANTAGPKFVEVFEKAKLNWRVELHTAAVRSKEDIASALRSFGATPSGGLIVQPDALTTVSRDLIISLAAELKMPAVYPFRVFTEAGGLMSYGLDPVEAYRETADYVDRVLRGVRPADLPVQAPRKFDLVINLKTAKTLGFELSAKLLAIADEVIE